MTSAYILIAAILVLGGLIAMLGDRLGSKVGKARLRLFNLRPRQTAVVVTVMTGISIAASTLGILFTLSKSLREGVFELDDILKQLRIVRADLEKVSGEKNQVEAALAEAKTEQLTVQKRLNSTNQNFKLAQDKLKVVSSQAKQLRTDIKTLLDEREQLRQQKLQLDRQLSQLQGQIQAKDKELNRQEDKIASQDRSLQERQRRLQELQKQFQDLKQQQVKLQEEIDLRDNLIAQLDQDIAARDLSLRKREKQLVELDSQLKFLQREVEILEQYYQTYQDLRERRIAIVRGQVLAFGAVRIVESQGAIEAIDELLRQANRTAIQATRVGNADPSERVVQITKAQVEQLAQQLQDGKDYVVRIISAGNYVQGEKEIRVFADITRNQIIFNQDETIATISLDSVDTNEEDLQKRLDLLLSATQFRARSAGILGNIQVEDGRIKTLINFVEQISKSEENLDEVKAIAADNTYTAGPLKIRLIAIKDGEVIFTT